MDAHGVYRTHHVSLVLPSIPLQFRYSSLPTMVQVTRSAGYQKKSGRIMSSTPEICEVFLSAYGDFSGAFRNLTARRVYQRSSLTRIVRRLCADRSVGFSCSIKPPIFLLPWLDSFFTTSLTHSCHPQESTPPCFLFWLDLVCMVVSQVNKANSIQPGLLHSTYCQSSYPGRITISLSQDD